MERQEAIRRIKAWKLDEDDMEVLAELIPELKDSEYERIRKDILAFFKAKKVKGEKQPILDEWIKWLEEQEESDELEFIPVESTLEFKAGLNAGRNEVKWNDSDQHYFNELVDFLKNKKTKLQHDLDIYVSWMENRFRYFRPWKLSLSTADLENELCDIQDNYADTSHEYKVLGEAIEYIRRENK